MLLPILPMASSIELVTWSFVPTQMQDFSTKLTPAVAQVFLSENEPYPWFNGAILSIAQIIKFVMASATKSEHAALFVMAREMIPHRQTLISMGWPQPKNPIQTDNSTATGVTNKMIVPRWAKIVESATMAILLPLRLD
jgi:hypothetical protein